MLNKQPFKQIRSAITDNFRLGGGRVIQRDGDREVIVYETSSPDKALAKLAEFLDSTEIRRLEAHLGRDLASVISPEVFRRRMDQQARAYVILGKPVPEFSVDWANLLDAQGIISLTITRDKGKRQPAQGSESAAKAPSLLTAEQIQALKKDIVSEILYAVRQEQQKTGPTVAVGGLDLICRDPAHHAYLEQITANVDAWTKTLKSVLSKVNGVVLAPTFIGGYRFELEGPRTAPLGQGSLLAVIHPAEHSAGSENDEPPKPTPRPVSETDSPTATTPSAPQPAIAEGTYEIGDEADYHPMVHVQCSVVGANDAEPAQPLSLKVPGRITRQFLAPALAQRDPHSLRLVSEDRHALDVAVEGNCLIVSAKVRQRSDGSQKPTHYLVDSDGHETPLVGRKKIRDGGTAVILVGGESSAQSHDPEGNLLRPVRVEISLPIGA